MENNVKKVRSLNEKQKYKRYDPGIVGKLLENICKIGKFLITHIHITHEMEVKKWNLRSTVTPSPPFDQIYLSEASLRIIKIEEDEKNTRIDPFLYIRIFCTLLFP